MAIVEETIGTGQDRTTITLWEANVGNFGTDTYKGIVSTNDEFNENVTLTGGTGTPSITSYLWLTTNPANRHSGVAGTGHGRIRGNTNGSHVINVDAPFTRIDWLEIQQDSTGGSDEGIRVLADRDDVLIDYCIIWTDTDTANQDGVYMGTYSVSNLRVSNTIIYGFPRSQINLQNSNQTTNYTQILDADHCTLYHDSASGASANERGAIHVRSQRSTSTATVGVYNTIGYMEYLTQEPFVDRGGTERGVPVGTVTWNGSNNLRGDQGTGAEIDGTNNTTSWQSATNGKSGTTQSSGSYVVFSDITVATYDFTLLDNAAGNLAAGNGTDRQGSEPDTRQDFSVDITGVARSTTTIDIGAHNVNQDAVGFLPFVRNRRLTTVRM